MISPSLRFDAGHNDTTHSSHPRLKMETAMPTKRFTLTTAAIAGALMLAACSSTSTPTAAHTRPSAHPAGNVTGAAGATTASAGGGVAASSGADPCSLLTQAEVDKAVGQPLGAGKATIPHYDCTWGTSDFAASVSVTVSDWTAIKTSATANGHTPASVPGVGDEALSSGGGLLYVRKGSSGFLLLIGGPHIDSSPDHGLAAEKVLAAAVLGRL
jgi:hypothetical protein